MRQTLSSSLYQALVATVIVVGLLSISQAQVMQSSNYKMQSDSVNAGGGLSNSASYSLQDTTGEIATGNSTSSSYRLKAGYQQMQEVYLSLSAISNVVMTPSLGGLTGGTATGSTAFVVTTDSPAGYSATIVASTSPALQSGSNSIADYVPAGAVPDFLFTTGPTNAHFAYSPEGPDIALRFQDAGSVCGVSGGDSSNRCWDGLKTTAVEIARRNVGNHPQGATTTIKFSVGIGNSAGVPPGQYRATTTITAISL